MEITQQPPTIGEMSPGHFETFITNIIKHVTDERFDAIEQRLDKTEYRLDHIETDSIQTTKNIIELGNAVEELKEGQLRADKNFRQIDEHFRGIDANFRQVKDLLNGNQTRFEHIEREQNHQARKLEKLVA